MSMGEQAAQPRSCGRSRAQLTELDDASVAHPVVVGMDPVGLRPVNVVPEPRELGTALDFKHQSAPNKHGHQVQSTAHHAARVGWWSRELKNARETVQNNKITIKRSKLPYMISTAPSTRYLKTVVRGGNWNRGNL